MIRDVDGGWVIGVVLWVFLFYGDPDIYDLTIKLLTKLAQ